mgnify:FL=1
MKKEDDKKYLCQHITYSNSRSIFVVKFTIHSKTDKAITYRIRDAKRRVAVKELDIIQTDIHLNVFHGQMTVFTLNESKINSYADSINSLKIERATKKLEQLQEVLESLKKIPKEKLNIEIKVVEDE